MPSSTEVTLSRQASYFDRDRQVSPAQAHSSMNPKTSAMNAMPNKETNQRLAKSNFLDADQTKAQRVSLESSLCFAKLPPPPHTILPKKTLFDRACAEITPQIGTISPDTYPQEVVPHVGKQIQEDLPNNPDEEIRTK